MLWLGPGNATAPCSHIASCAAAALAKSEPDVAQLVSESSAVPFPELDHAAVPSVLIPAAFYP